MEIREATLLDRYWASYPPAHVSLRQAVIGLGVVKPVKNRVLDDVSGAKARAMRLAIEKQMRGRVN